MPIDFQKLRRDLGNSRNKQVIEFLMELPESEKGSFADTISQLSADEKQFMMDELHDIKSSDELGRIRRGITKRLLGLLREMEAESTQTDDARKDSEVVNEQGGTPPTGGNSGSATKTILFVAANPKDTGRLRLTTELREVRGVFDAATFRDEYELEDIVAARIRDLSRGLLKNKPYILHFSGHGVRDVGDQSVDSEGNTRGLDLDWEDENTEPEYQGGIALVNNEGNTQIVAADALANLIKLFPSIKCVFLNACYSEAQAQAIIPHGPCVIGMNTAIPDPVAISFARAFYEALGENQPISDAFAYAQAVVNLEGLNAAAIPQLICP